MPSMPKAPPIIHQLIPYDGEGGPFWICDPGHTKGPGEASLEPRDVTCEACLDAIAAARGDAVASTGTVVDVPVWGAWGPGGACPDALGMAECQLPFGHAGPHRFGGITWGGTPPVATAPAAGLGPEKLEGLRGLAAKVTPLTGEETVEARSGLHSLLSEREELLAERDRLAARLASPHGPEYDQGYEDGESSATDTFQERLDEALSLLREVEWSGKPLVEALRTCPKCGGVHPDDYDGAAAWIAAYEATRGHTPDCRLSAHDRQLPTRP